ncbi:MAG TPA: STAS domain-containing protein [Candidatus Sulfopaludibacter sp.]|nr:STAS domain-containing protein [Candidatus Sulfopaludibacter sp.]
MLVLACKDFVCVKIAGRANFTYGPDFKTLLTELVRKGYRHFIIDLSECALMDSTFLGILAGFGLKLNQSSGQNNHGVELLNPNSRITDLLENLGALHLFKVSTGTLQLPGDVQMRTPESASPTRQQMTRTCLEAHQSLMEANPDNVLRFKDVTRFLAEDLKNLEKSP